MKSVRVTQKSARQTRQPVASVLADHPANTKVNALDSASPDAAGQPDFPIVGIGASAGGLEAFETFFRQVTPGCGIAFVLVPHLDPDHPSILSEILQRVTTLTVHEARDHIEVAPDHVYIIPPNSNLAISDGKLRLSLPLQPRGQRMPIDFFMQSLADDRAESAIGIVLSGTGTDGTLGLSAIHSAGGVCMVQEPDTAKYDGMPQNAIQAGHATHILPVEQMPKTLLDVIRRHAARPALPQNTDLAVLGGMNLILQELRNATGHDFSQYKKSTINRRIERRMSEHSIKDISLYQRYLQQHPAEITRLFKELLINVTCFFRDPEAFAALQREILPGLLDNKPDGYVFRVWVVGCASGEEAYSLAILLCEFMDESRLRFKVQIYATDLDEDVIAIARAGSYSQIIEQDVSPERLRRFFERERAGYRVHKDIREMIIFAVHNVIKDPPFTRLDLLSCRNLLIYLEPALQNRLLINFHYALKPNGVLFLSVSEGITGHPELFPTLSRKWKLFRAAENTGIRRIGLSAELSGRATEEHDVRSNLPGVALVSKARVFNAAEITQRALLQFYAPPSVLTDALGNIAYIYGDTARYLRPPPGPVTLNVVDMAKVDLQPVVRVAIAKAACDEASPQSLDLSMKIDGGFSMVRFSLRKLPGLNDRERSLLLSFQEIPAPSVPLPEQNAISTAANSNARRRAEELERELAYHRETLQFTIEAQQASNEELTSANEELQTTNEELETSREELNSLNEELVTVNAELNAKVGELTAIQNDMKNLLDNVGVATIFLDTRLNVRRFTPAAQRLYRLLESDIGRPLADIKSDMSDDSLLSQAQIVLDTLLPYEGEVSTQTGVSYLTQIQPYRTLDNVVSGIVMTFSDISLHVAAQAEVQLAREMAEGIVDTVRESLVVLDSDLKVVFASRSFYREFEVTPEETLGHQIYELGNRQWDIPSLRELLENILPQDNVFEGYSVEHEFPGIGKRRMQLNGRSIIGKGGARIFILLTMANIAMTNNSLAGEA
jgi:two-component system CheB/CheR fusion protein